jgi:hypothetical protein
MAKLPAHLAVEARRWDLQYRITVTAFWAILTSLLIWLAAFRRANVARWAYALLFVLSQSIPLFLLSRGPEARAIVLKDYLDDLSNVRFYIAVVPVIAAIVFSFTGNATAWFRSRSVP